MHEPGQWDPVEAGWIVQKKLLGINNIKMNNLTISSMKRNVIMKIAGMVAMILLVSAPAINVYSQDEDKPVRKVFESISLIENQTTENLYQGGLKFEISHRFSQIEEISDLFGIYGSANTRLALDYGIRDRIMVGFGTTRDYKLQDLEWKISLLKQTESGKIPVSVSYYGNAVLDARSDDNFGPEESYRFIHRLSYLTQLIVSRKFGEKVSLQMSPSFAYFNAVDPGYKNANFDISFGGRAQVLGLNSIIFEYDQPLTQGDGVETHPNIAAGVEIGTSTHAFRLFVSNYNAIIKQRNMVYNSNDPFDGDFLFGFNISVALR